MTDIWHRLKKRKMVQWAVAYLAGAWVLLQVLDLAVDNYEWPTLVIRLAFALIALGFVLMLVLAWYHGERGVQKVSGTELLILTVLFAVGGFLIWNYGSNDTASLSEGSRANAEALTGRNGIATEPEAIPDKSIAVLPFENLSGDKDNEYFASGMQDMILTKLAGISDLKVISRTSTEKYASRPDDLKAIAQQLGVATILEGSVQKSGNSVLINVQLIDANTDAHLWAEAYPRTLDNIFGVEGEVAQKIADALQAKLTSAETASVASVPTQNAEAYEVFLKAEYQREQAWSSRQDSDYLAAEAGFRDAIALDPTFALARARLAYTQLNRHWFAVPLTQPELADAKQSIDRALALAPELPEAHLALGYYDYWGFRRYDEATAEFRRALQLSPNNIEAITGLAYIVRRKGQLSQALAYFEQGLRLSPRDSDMRGEIGWTYLLMRRYPEADRQLKLALAMSPEDANTKEALLQVWLFGFGDVQGARKILQHPPAWQVAGANAIGGDILYLVNRRAYTNFFDRKFADALHDWDGAPTDTEEDRRSGKVARAVIKLIAGKGASVQADCASLEPVLKAALAKDPDSQGLLQQLSWVEVCLGQNHQAIATAQKAVDVLPLGKDAFFGAYPLSGLAQIATHADAPDLALKVIRQLLAMPAGTVMSIERLKLDPVYDPLRKDPRFQALLKNGGHD